MCTPAKTPHVPLQCALGHLARDLDRRLRLTARDLSYHSGSKAVEETATGLLGPGWQTMESPAMIEQVVAKASLQLVSTSLGLVWAVVSSQAEQWPTWV